MVVPLASLFLILVLCVFGVQRQPSVGIRIPITRIRTVPFNICPGIYTSIHVQLHKDGSYWINETQVPANEFRSRLAEIYEDREEKILPRVSDPNASLEDFANFYSNAASSTKDLHIVLRTRGLEAQLEQCPPGRSCGLDLPGSAYTPCSVPELVPPIPIHTTHDTLR